MHRCHVRVDPLRARSPRTRKKPQKALGLRVLGDNARQRPSAGSMVGMEIEHLINTWRGPLVGLLAGWGAPWADATELAQDTLVEAYLSRARLRGDPSDPNVIGPWLRGIARNLFRARRRAASRRREEELEHERTTAVSTDTSGDLDPEDARLEAVRCAMARLPEKFRAVLYMHYLEETPVREVASLLGLPEKTVEGRLHQARQALRRVLFEAPSATNANEARS